MILLVGLGSCRKRQTRGRATTRARSPFWGSSVRITRKSDIGRRRFRCPAGCDTQVALARSCWPDVLKWCFRACRPSQFNHVQLMSARAGGHRSYQYET